MEEQQSDDVIEATPENIQEVASNGNDKDEKKLNQRLTGEWLVTSINYNFNKVSDFTQEVTLVRRELSFNENDFAEDKSY